MPEVSEPEWVRLASLALSGEVAGRDDVVAKALWAIEPQDQVKVMLAWIDSTLHATGMHDVPPSERGNVYVREVSTESELSRAKLPLPARRAARLVECRMNDDFDAWAVIIDESSESDEEWRQLFLTVLHVAGQTIRKTL